MTPEELFAYADKFARRKERAGFGTKYPTVRQVKRRFGVDYEAIEDACAMYHGAGYLGLGVGFQAGGLGGGTCYIERPNDHVVEAYI